MAVLSGVGSSRRLGRGKKKAGKRASERSVWLCSEFRRQMKRKIRNHCFFLYPNLLVRLDVMPLAGKTRFFPVIAYPAKALRHHMIARVGYPLSLQRPVCSTSAVVAFDVSEQVAFYVESLCATGQLADVRAFANVYYRVRSQGTRPSKHLSTLRARVAMLFFLPHGCPSRLCRRFRPCRPYSYRFYHPCLIIPTAQENASRVHTRSPAPLNFDLRAQRVQLWHYVRCAGRVLV